MDRDQPHQPPERATARTKSGTPPNYPAKSHNGQARFTVQLTTGARHDLYLGLHGNPANWQEYRRVLAVLEAQGGHYLDQQNGRAAAAGRTLTEVVLAFWGHAAEHYRRPDGKPSRELKHFQNALEPTLDRYGRMLAIKVGPVDLKSVRQRLIDRRTCPVRLTGLPDGPARWGKAVDMRRPGGVAVEAGPAEARWGPEWRPVTVLRSAPARSRKVINQRIDHIKRVRARAASDEVVPVTVIQALKTVAGLRRGYDGTRDHPR